LLAAMAALVAPYVDAELGAWLEPHTIIDSAPAKIEQGRMVDDYFAVQDLGDGTFGSEDGDFKRERTDKRG
jgi:hypothetical protein